jgi:hypothetical protein
MDKDLATAYALISAGIGALFGIEMGVFFCSIAGSLLAVRFCSAKTKSERFWYFIISVFFACLIVGETAPLYPVWVPVKIAAVMLGFLFLLIAEIIYYALKSARSINWGDKLSLLADRIIDKWTL